MQITKGTTIYGVALFRWRLPNVQLNMKYHCSNTDCIMYNYKWSILVPMQITIGTTIYEVSLFQCKLQQVQLYKNYDDVSLFQWRLPKMQLYINILVQKQITLGLTIYESFLFQRRLPKVQLCMMYPCSKADYLRYNSIWSVLFPTQIPMQIA